MPKHAIAYAQQLTNAIQQWAWHGGVVQPLGKAAADFVRNGDMKGFDPDTQQYAKTLVTAIRSAPEESGNLFRGESYDTGKMPKNYATAKRGDVWRVDTPSSFSSSGETAKAYQAKAARPEKVRIIIQDRYKGLHIGDVDHPDDHEVLTYGRFRVEQNVVNKQGMRVITLRQLSVH